MTLNDLLIRAVRSGGYSEAKDLLLRGASPNTRDSELNDTVFGVAWLFDYSMICALLLEHGAKSNFDKDVEAAILEYGRLRRDFEEIRRSY